MSAEQEMTGSDSADSPMRLLGHALEEACGSPERDTLALQAIVTFCAEYAHVSGVAFAELREAIHQCIETHAQGCDEQSRRQLGATLVRWATVAYLDHGGA